MDSDRTFLYALGEHVFEWEARSCKFCKISKIQRITMLQSAESFGKFQLSYWGGGRGKKKCTGETSAFNSFMLVSTGIISYFKKKQKLCRGPNIQAASAYLGKCSNTSPENALPFSKSLQFSFNNWGEKKNLFMFVYAGKSIADWNNNRALLPAGLQRR